MATRNYWAISLPTKYMYTRSLSSNVEKKVNNKAIRIKRKRGKPHSQKPANRLLARGSRLA